MFGKRKKQARGKRLVTSLRKKQAGNIFPLTYLLIRDPAATQRTSTEDEKKWQERVNGGGHLIQEHLDASMSRHVTSLVVTSTTHVSPFTLFSLLYLSLSSPSTMHTSCPFPSETTISLLHNDEAHGEPRATRATDSSLFFFFQAKLPLLAGSVLPTLLHLPFRRANSRQSLLQTTFCDSNSHPSIATTLFLYFTPSGSLCPASARASPSPRARFFSCFCSNFT